jgi:hypothetical protein
VASPILFKLLHDADDGRLLPGRHVDAAEGSRGSAGSQAGI